MLLTLYKKANLRINYLKNIIYFYTRPNFDLEENVKKKRPKKDLSEGISLTRVTSSAVVRLILTTVFKITLVLLKPPNKYK